MLVGAGNNKLFYELMERLGLKNIAESTNYETNELRVKHREELVQILSKRFLDNVCTVNINF